MSERCWNCLKPLPDSDTFGIVTVIHEAAADNEDHIVRRCCNTTCARQACTWTKPGNRQKDNTHIHLDR